MGKKVSSAVKKYTTVGLLFDASSKALGYTDKRSADQALQDAEAKAASDLAAKQAELDKAKEAEAQQEAVRKKMASLGRLQAGYTFSDSQASTGATKVFS